VGPLFRLSVLKVKEKPAEVIEMKTLPSYKLCRIVISARCNKKQITSQNEKPNKIYTDCLALPLPRLKLQNWVMPFDKEINSLIPHRCYIVPLCCCSPQFRTSSGR